MNAGNQGALPASTGFRSSSRTGGPQVNWGKRKHGQIPFEYDQFTPEQNDLFSQLFGYLGKDSFLGKIAGGDEETFDKFEEPAWRQFQGATGGLANRFSKTGSRRSSDFQNASTQMGHDFANELSQNRFNMQNQATKDLMQMANMLLGKQPKVRGMLGNEKKPSIWQKILGMLGGSGGQGLSWESLLGGV